MTYRCRPTRMIVVYLLWPMLLPFVMGLTHAPSSTHSQQCESTCVTASTMVLLHLFLIRRSDKNLDPPKSKHLIFIDFAANRITEKQWSNAQPASNGFTNHVCTFHVHAFARRRRAGAVQTARSRLSNSLMIFLCTM